MDISDRGIIRSKKNMEYHEYMGNHKLCGNPESKVSGKIPGRQNR